MALNGNGTSQYLGLGTATVISRNIPLTVMALVDSTSLRTTGNFAGIIGQGDYGTTGGMSFQLEISAAASPLLVFSASTSTSTGTYAATADSTGGPVITPNTGWWLVAACVRHVTNALQTQYYAYRFNTGTLTTAAGGGIATFVAGTTQLAPPAATAITAVAAEGEITVTDWFPGAFAWCGVWNADLSDTQNANPKAIWTAITEGPLAIADSTLAGLWILDNGDAHDYSANAHNGTYQGSPTFVGTPVNYLPLAQAYRTTAAAAAGSNPLAGTGGIVSSGTGDLSQTDALAGSGAIATGGTGALSTTGSNPLAGSGGIVTGGTADLSQTDALAGSGAIQSGGTGALVQTEPLAGTGTIATGGTGTLTNTGGGSGTANFAIGVKTAGTGGNDLSPAVVRDSSNRLWRAAATTGTSAFDNGSGQYNGNTLRMFRADQDQVPSSFTEVDSAHRPTNVGSFSIAIDGSDLIHVAFVHSYAAATTGIYYTTFNTTTNLWSGVETKVGTVNYASTATYVLGDAGVALALDASGVPHVVSYGQVSGTGATHIFYTNKVGGTWAAALQLDTATLAANQRCMHPACMFDSTGALHVAWMTITANYGATLEKCFYIKRSSGGTFGSVTQFAENLLGSIDNGPSLYVSEDDHIHIAYGLGDGTTASGQTVTGTTVNNSVFYRVSSDGGATWNTTTQPAHFVSHDFNIGPDGFGGIHLWSHSQPTTVDGLGTAIGYAALAKGSSSWVAWAQKANDATGNGFDCTTSPRRAKFFHNRPAYLDVAYFDLNLPASAMLGSDPAGNALVGQTETGAIATGGSGSLTTSGSNPLAGSGAIATGGTGALAQTEPLAGSGAIQSGGSGALSQTDALVGTGTIQSGGTGALSQTEPLAGTGAIQSGGSAALTQTEPLAGSGGIVTGGSAGLSQTDALAGSGAIQTGGAGNLTQTEPLAGSGAITTGGTGTLSNVPSGSDPLAGTGAIATGGSGALSQTEPLGGTGAIQSGGAGTLTTKVPLAGSGAIATGGTGALSQTDALAGSGAVQTGGAGALVQKEPLAGSGAIASSGTATLTNASPIVLGTLALTVQAVTTVTLTVQAVTTLVLVVTDEEGNAVDHFTLGNIVRIDALIKDINLAAVDPAAISVTTVTQDGVPTTATPTKIVTGDWRYDFKPAERGIHTIRAVATNPDAAEEVQINVTSFV